MGKNGIKIIRLMFVYIKYVILIYNIHIFNEQKIGTVLI
jgi:hypothetical protein